MSSTPFLARPIISITRANLAINTNVKSADVSPQIFNELNSPKFIKNAHDFYEKTRPTGTRVLDFDEMSGAQFHRLPNAIRHFPSVGFLGKANVGKSSLINAIFYAGDPQVQREKWFEAITNPHNISRNSIKNIAPVANRAGKTQHIFRFDLKGKLRLIDFPGYGFQSDSISPDQAREFAREIDAFFNPHVIKQNRLSRLFLLINIGEQDRLKKNSYISDLDLKLMKSLYHVKKIPSSVRLSFILTKSDRCGSTPMEMHERISIFFQDLHRYGILDEFSSELADEIFVTSNLSQGGILELRRYIYKMTVDYREMAKSL